MYFEKNSIYKIITHESLFSSDECDKIINHEGFFEDSTIQLYSQQSYKLNYKPVNRLTNNTTRSSKSKYLDLSHENNWIFERFINFTNKINQQYFKYNLESYTGTQIIKYEKGDFFNIHVDVGIGEIANRKLSLVVFLSSKKDYEGGELKWFPDIEHIEQEQGTIIIFPSYFPHKVEPVIKGTRYVLVSWGCE